MRILIACEHTGRVRDEFLRRGFDAWSCDLLPCESPIKGRHLQRDVRDVLHLRWTFMLAHPDCTYLTAAAEWAYKDVQTKRIKPGTLVGAARRKAREEAIAFALELANADIEHIAIENPVGVLSSVWRKPDQYIQPHHYGDDASKNTCLWLKNLPPLESDPTEYVQPRWVRNANGKLLPRWANQTDSGQNREPPSTDRWKVRSGTYPGWARAFAKQWGDYLRGLYL